MNTAIMSFTIDKILISFGFIILFTLLIGTRVGLAIDITYPDHFLQLNDDRNPGDYIHYLGKRRFLPTRRESEQYVNDNVSSEDDEDYSNLNKKRYFLRTRRYFLKTKRNYNNDHYQQQVYCHILI
ncbi:unnamed protein product [Rotaria sordida]|uniref:Uncharacterized protein n=1 Tax=Rotaria sordida TaxID=392033 RepID=A0A813ULN8_9BILA|nr:unnamed protein product [Rotaria sordida]